MGNTSQCTLLSNNDQQFRLLGEENHFLFGQIHHIVTQKPQQIHFAIKKKKFPSQRLLKSYKDLIELYQQFCSSLHLIKASLYIDSKARAGQKQDKQKGRIETKQSEEPIFHCNKENSIFSSPSQSLSCSEPSYLLNVNFEYLEQKNTLRSILLQKSNKLAKTLENNKINQNILIELQSKVKLCEYGKIDKLPHKERSINNLFFTEIQVLRIFDSMLTSLYGLKFNGFIVDAVRPQLFFTQSGKQQVTYFFPQILELKNLGNLQKSYESVKKWLDQQKALFHHNWNTKEREFIFYVHPDHLEKLSCALLEDELCNEKYFQGLKSKEFLQRENLFSLGLFILQACLLEPFICSKLYQVSICKSSKKIGATTKKQMKFSFEKDNLTLKFNHSLLQKLLIQMKTRYSDKFVDLIEFMLFGGSKCQSLANSTVYEPFNLQRVIQKLSQLIGENVQNLKEVYNESQKSKSRSKESSQKQSRKSSITRQVSVSNCSNPSLSSSASFSIFPVQSQQKVSSVNLLRKSCDKLESEASKVLIKSELQTLHESFTKKQTKLQSLISKDQERILSQLNRLNNPQHITLKQARFGYRKMQDQSPTIDLIKNNKLLLQNSNIEIVQKNQLQNNAKISTPVSALVKLDSISQEKEKRINSSSKIKKNIIQKVKQEEKMGNSVCQKISLHQQKGVQNQSIETVKSKQFQKIRQIEPFSEISSDRFSFKSELKSFIIAKDKKAKINPPKPQPCPNQQDKFPKELKSNELYAIYMKEYKNLVESQNLSEL